MLQEIFSENKHQMVVWRVHCTNTLFVVCENLSLNHGRSYAHVVFQLAWEVVVALYDLRRLWDWVSISESILSQSLKLALRDRCFIWLYILSGCLELKSVEYIIFQLLFYPAFWKSGSRYSEGGKSKNFGGGSQRESCNWYITALKLCQWMSQKTRFDETNQTFVALRAKCHGAGLAASSTVRL